FLARTSGAAFGYVLAPSLITMISRRAMGQDALPCQSLSSLEPSTMGAVIEYHARGGAAWAEDFFCRTRDGQAIEGRGDIGAYENFGHTIDRDFNSAGVTADTRLGVPFHPDSPLLAGLMSTLLPDAVQHIDG